jgi:hypothetical protein
MYSQLELRDPIHGFIQRSDLEARIIDTSVFQRLRGIKQLALANLVYPGANHTRFDHSIGVMHVAGRLALQLLGAASTEKIRLVRLCALLHDVGHGPFSHVAEEILDNYFDTGKVKPPNREKIHELITCQIIESNQELAEHLSPADKEQVVKVLKGLDGDALIRGIVSGPLDADKQDYLLRDSYFCGVKYGVFDLERLIGTLRSYPDEFNNFLAASEDGVHAVEQYIIAKYHMSTQVYGHKVRLVTDSMITRAFELGIEFDNLDWLKKLFVYDGSEKFIQNYLEWDDARVTTALLYPLQKGGLATELFWKLKKRQLFKRIYERRIADFEGAVLKKVLLEKLKNRQFLQTIEEKIAEYLSSQFNATVPKYHVVVKSFAIKSVKEQSRDSEGSIIILAGDKNPTKFEDISTLFHSINEKENDQFIEVYAPMKYDGDVDRRKKKGDCEVEITKILLKGLDLQKEFDYNQP